MEAECNFVVRSAYSRNILRIFLGLFPLSASMFMVWATIFHQPEEWYVVGAWILGLIFSSWLVYHSIFYRATLISNEYGFKYIEKNKVILEHEWGDIEVFKTFKDNSLDGTTATIFVYKELNIGGMYSASYKQDCRVKNQEITMDDNGVEFILLLGSDFKKKQELVKLLNRCKLLRTE